MTTLCEQNNSRVKEKDTTQQSLETPTFPHKPILFGRSILGWANFLLGLSFLIWTLLRWYDFSKGTIALNFFMIGFLFSSFFWEKTIQTLFRLCGSSIKHNLELMDMLAFDTFKIKEMMRKNENKTKRNRKETKKKSS